ncbi:MAG: DUF1801 domain-containing protein [Bacteroidia bacterium]|nr:DUF1801 domain-containing protein [Bacteroidia bacterium]
MKDINLPTQKMQENKTALRFLAQYPETVFSNALKLREVLLACLPGIIEQVDTPAKMVAYCYGQKYTEMICTIIPSQKGLKLGFAYGTSLPDPHEWLQGTGKLSRYIEIKTEKQLKSAALKKLLKAAHKAYGQRTAN